jgi:hypothetical protein
LRAAECPQDIRWALLGHEEKPVAEDYGKGFSLPQLKRWIDKIGFWRVVGLNQAARRKVRPSPSQRCRFESERREWLQVLAREIGAQASVEALEATIALLPVDDWSCRAGMGMRRAMSAGRILDLLRSGYSTCDDVPRTLPCFRFDSRDTSR